MTRQGGRTARAAFRDGARRAAMVLLAAMIAGGAAACTARGEEEAAGQRSAASATPARSSAPAQSATPAQSPSSSETEVPEEGVVYVGGVDRDMTGTVTWMAPYKISIDGGDGDHQAAWLQGDTVVTGQVCGARRECKGEYLEGYLKKNPAGFRAHVTIRGGIAQRITEVER